MALLQEQFPANGLSVEDGGGETAISGSVSEQIKYDAVLSVLVALLGILFYVAVRFEMGYAIGAVVATIHDVLMTIGLFVLLGTLSGGTICSGQFTAPMLASVLMIVGYSINDTIVVFDRIREELEMNPVTNLGKSSHRHQPRSLPVHHYQRYDTPCRCFPLGLRRRGNQ